MTRREFLKGAGVFVLALSGIKSVGSIEKLLTPNAETAIGPLLVPGLRTKKTAEGGAVYYEGTLLFTVNDTGVRLLEMADGTNTLDHIIVASGTTDIAADTAMFFVTLGQAGYLQNRVEVQINEVKA